MLLGGRVKSLYQENTLVAFYDSWNIVGKGQTVHSQVDGISFRWGLPSQWEQRYVILRSVFSEDNFYSRKIAHDTCDQLEWKHRGWSEFDRSFPNKPGSVLWPVCGNHRCSSLKPFCGWWDSQISLESKNESKRQESINLYKRNSNSKKQHNHEFINCRRFCYGTSINQHNFSVRKRLGRMAMSTMHVVESSIFQ